ncbi:hypothetical protein MTP99_001665 [Tenebrio molitor]|jgi:hypothetical protein|nr:hypothetical protein MTP99_001665 [Tenebrio molitor]
MRGDPVKIQSRSLRDTGRFEIEGPGEIQRALWNIQGDSEEIQQAPGWRGPVGRFREDIGRPMGDKNRYRDGTGTGRFKKVQGDSGKVREDTWEVQGDTGEVQGDPGEVQGDLKKQSEIPEDALI